MAKSKSSGADARPSDEAISQRAYELYLERGFGPGNETQDWLQAEAELLEGRRSAEAAFAPAGDDQGDSAGDESTSVEASSTDGRKTNGRREGSTAGRRALRE